MKEEVPAQAPVGQRCWQPAAWVPDGAGLCASVSAQEPAPAPGGRALATVHRALRPCSLGSQMPAHQPLLADARDGPAHLIWPPPQLALALGGEPCTHSCGGIITPKPGQWTELRNVCTYRS